MRRRTRQNGIDVAGAAPPARRAKTATAQRRPLRGKHRDQVRAEVTTSFVTDRMSVPEIAAHQGLRPSVVRTLLDEASVRGTDQHCVGLNEQDTADNLARRHRAGASMSELARQTGMDRRVIRGLLVQAGVDLPVFHSLSPEQAVEVADRYRAGESIRMLAASIGCSYSTIRAALHRAGVELRPRGGGSVRLSPAARVGESEPPPGPSEPPVPARPARPGELMRLGTQRPTQPPAPHSAQHIQLDPGCLMHVAVDPNSDTYATVEIAHAGGGHLVLVLAEPTVNQLGEALDVAKDEMQGTLPELVTDRRLPG